MFTELYSIIVNGLNIDSPVPPTMGIYYDDPDLVDPKECRYAVGALIDPSEDEEKRKQINGLLLEKEYKSHHLPNIDHVVW